MFCHPEFVSGSDDEENMPDMYDKLGEMLNEALESGKIPQNKEPEDTENTPPEHVEGGETTAYSGSFILNDKSKSRETSKKSLKSEKKHQIPTGEVIKMHKYTYNMQYPPQIQSALATLDIVYPFTVKDITASYHKKLKEVHPDTQSTIQTSKSVQNNRRLTIDEIRQSYQILCDFFGIK